VPRIRELYWDDNNRDHLWQSHQVTPEEVEETLFSEDGEEAAYVPFRVRNFAARDMDDREKRAFRKR
jgi:hypothetical protein